MQHVFKNLASQAPSVSSNSALENPSIKQITGFQSTPREEKVSPSSRISAIGSEQVLPSTANKQQSPDINFGDVRAQEQAAHRDLEASTCGHMRSSQRIKEILALQSAEDLQDFLASLILCELAYKKLETEPSQLAVMCSDLQDLFPPGSVSIDAMQGSIADSSQHFLIATGSDALYVAFMGTKQPRDLRADLSFLHEPIWKEAMDLAKDSKSVPAAHAGFLERSRAVNIEQLNELATSSGRRLVLCGHSLGGAVAKLTALRLLRELPEWPTPALRCICFATPAVGNASLASLVRDAGWASHFKTYFLPEDQLMRLVGFSQRRDTSETLSALNLPSPSPSMHLMTMDGADEEAIESILAPPPGLVTSRSSPDLSTASHPSESNNIDQPFSKESSQHNKFNLGLTIALQQKQAQRMLMRFAQKIRVPLPSKLRPFHVFGDQITVFPDGLVKSSDANGHAFSTEHKKRSAKTEPSAFDLSSSVKGPFSYHRMKAFRLRILGLVINNLSAEERAKAAEKLARTTTLVSSANTHEFVDPSSSSKCASCDLFPRITVESTSSQSPILPSSSSAKDSSSLVPITVQVEGQHLNLCRRVNASYTPLLSSQDGNGVNSPSELKLATEVIEVIKPTSATTLGREHDKVGRLGLGLSSFSPLSLIQRMGCYMIPLGSNSPSDSSTRLILRVMVPKDILTKLLQTSSTLKQAEASPNLTLKLQSDFHETYAEVAVQPLKAACLGTSALAAALLQAALSPSSSYTPSADKSKSSNDSLVGTVASAATAVIRRGYSATSVVWSLAPQPLQWAAKQIWSGSTDQPSPSFSTAWPPAASSESSSLSLSTPRSRSLSPFSSRSGLSSTASKAYASRERWRLLRQRRIQALLFPVTTLLFVAQLLKQTAISIVMARAAAWSAKASSSVNGSDGFRSFVLSRRRGSSSGRLIRVSASGGDLANEDTEIVRQGVGGVPQGVGGVPQGVGGVPQGVGGVPQGLAIEGGGNIVGMGAASAWPFRLVSNRARAAGKGTWWGGQGAHLAGFVSSWSSSSQSFRSRSNTSSSAQATLHPLPYSKAWMEGEAKASDPTLFTLFSSTFSGPSSPSLTRPSTPWSQMDLDDAPLLRSFKSNEYIGEDTYVVSESKPNGEVMAERLVLEREGSTSIALPSSSSSSPLLSGRRSVSSTALEPSSSSPGSTAGLKVRVSTSGGPKQAIKQEPAAAAAAATDAAPLTRPVLRRRFQTATGLARPKWRLQAAAAAALGLPPATPCFDGSLVIHNVLATAANGGNEDRSNSLPSGSSPHTSFSSPFVVLRALAASLRRQASRQRRQVNAWWGQKQQANNDITHMSNKGAGEYSGGGESASSDDERSNPRPSRQLWRPSGSNLLPALPHVHLYNLIRGIPLWIQQNRSQGAVTFDHDWKVLIVAASALDPSRLLQGRDFARMNMRAKSAGVDLVPVLFTSPSVPGVQKDQAVKTLAAACCVPVEAVRIVTLDDRLMLATPWSSSSSAAAASGSPLVLSSGEEARRLASLADGVEELKQQLQDLVNNRIHVV